MRRSSHKKISRLSHKGVKVSRPKFSVEKDDVNRGIKVFTGQEALSRSRHTLSSDRNEQRRSYIDSTSPKNTWPERKRNFGQNSNPKSITTSREIKVKIRKGQKSRANKMPNRVVDSLGGYFNKRIPKDLVQSINPQENKKVSINAMLRNSRGRSIVTNSISREPKHKGRSGSSLKHEVKIRSISRSRNLINLDEYCNKIERESRYMSGSIQNERESKHSLNKINTLMSNLQKIKKKPVNPVNNDYYALGRNQEKMRNNRNRNIRRGRQPESPNMHLSEQKLREIRKLFPFNQVWFWEMSSRSQENKLRKFNPNLLNQLKIPVKLLISKVKQSDHTTDSHIINLSRDKVVNSFADKRIEFGENPEYKARCKPFNREIKMDSNEEEEEGFYQTEWKESNNEVKGAYNRGQKEFRDDDFGNVDFNKRRKNLGFKNVNYRDKRDYNKISQNRGQGQQYSTRKFNANERQPRKNNSQVRIRNKQRNYNNKNFVHVNTKVTLNNNYRSNKYPRSNRHIIQNNQTRNYVQKSRPSNNYYSQRNIQPVINKRESPNKIYLDNLKIQKDPEEEDDFDDDYFEEKNQPLHKHISKKMAVQNTNHRSRNKYYKPKIISKKSPTEEVYQDTIIVNRDSDEEDYGDEYFEEREKRRRIKLQTGYRSRPKQNNGPIPQTSRNPPARRRDTDSEEVYHDEIQIARSSKDKSEDYGDEYFEERDSWRNRKQGVPSGQPSEIKDHSYFKNNQRINHNRQDSPQRAFVDKIEIRRDSKESDDRDDDYFEERDSWNNKNKHEKRKQTDNVFDSTFGNSNVQSKHSSNFRNQNMSSGVRSQNNALSSRFNSFAPGSQQGSRIQYMNSFGPETHYAQVETKNEMSPDDKLTSRETKGPVYYADHGSNRKDENKTQYTSSTYHNSKSKKSDVQFNNPYSAQIFTNEQVYMQNQKKNNNKKRPNTFADYYRTGR